MRKFQCFSFFPKIGKLVVFHNLFLKKHGSLGQGRKSIFYSKAFSSFSTEKLLQFYFCLETKPGKSCPLSNVGFHRLMDHCGQRPLNSGFMWKVQELYLLKLKPVALKASLYINKCLPVLRPWPCHSLKLFYVSSDWKDLCLGQCCKRLAASTGSRRALTKHSLVMLFSLNRVVSLGQCFPHPSKKLNQALKKKKRKAVANYLKTSWVWFFDSLSAIWIELSLSIRLEVVVWGKVGKRRMININSVGKTMDLKLRQGITGWVKEILNFCYDRIFCYSKVLLFSGCLFLHWEVNGVGS